MKVLLKKKKEAQEKIDRKRRKQVYTQAKLAKKALRKHQMHKYKSKNADAICYQNKEYKLRNADAIRRGNHEYKLRNVDALRQKQHEYYSKNADDLRQKRIKNYQISKGTWSQFSDFGKKNYSRPNQCKTKDAPSLSSTIINLSTINENSTPEEIRNAFKEDETSCNRRDSVENKMKEIQEKFIEINFVKNGEPDKQRANICVVCDELIIGLEPVKYLTKEQILNNKDRISVEAFEQHYVVELSEVLESQYRVEDEDLHGILLSPRGAQKCPLTEVVSYCCCGSCYNSMTSRSKDEKQNPPKFAIANGFVIGHIPRTDLTYHDSNGQPHRRHN